MKKRYLIITIIISLMFIPRVDASGAITQYSCLNGNTPVSCSGTLAKGTELVGNNAEAEHFIVMKQNADGSYVLMTKYLLVDDTTGYKQASNTTTGKGVTYGPSVFTNTGGTYAGDLALSYINSISTVAAPATAVNDPTTTGRNGIPSTTLICEYTGTCGAVSNEGSIFVEIQTRTGLTGDILLGNRDIGPDAYFTSSADGAIDGVQNIHVWEPGDGGTVDGDPVGVPYGVRPVFTISLFSLQGIHAPGTGIDMKSSLALSIIGIIFIGGMIVYMKKNKLLSE